MTWSLSTNAKERDRREEKRKTHHLVEAGRKREETHTDEADRRGNKSSQYLPIAPTYQGIPEKASHGQGNERIGSWDVALSHESQPRSPNQEDRGKQAQAQEPETQTDDRAERQPPGQPGKFRKRNFSSSLPFFRHRFDRFLGRRP